MAIYLERACSAFVDASHKIRTKMIYTVDDNVENLLRPLSTVVETIFSVGVLYTLVNRGLFSSPLKNALLLSSVFLLRGMVNPRERRYSFLSAHALVSIPLVLLASRSKLAALPLIAWTVTKAFWPASTFRA